MTAKATETGFRIKGWHVFAAVTAFFGVVIAVDAVFLVAAYRSFPGQVSVTPYEDGLAFNRDVARRRAQAALGWNATAGHGPGGVEVNVTDAAGAPVEGLRLTGLLRRPATESGEVQLRFSEAAPGRYLADARPGEGAWDLRVAAADHPFSAERRLTWP